MNNREKLRVFLFENRLTQKKAAEMIEELTCRPCSVRSMRTWLNDPTKSSSRPCPDWVLTVLKKAMTEKGDR
ncbi:hypothetical protein PST86_14675 [Yersinia pestis]|nr:hypothetical protein [Yersinia pestis]